jgi:hypothetical protein
MTNSDYNDHTNPLFFEHKILPFDKLLTLNRLLFIHSIASNYPPPIFTDTWLRNEDWGRQRYS